MQNLLETIARNLFDSAYREETGELPEDHIPTDESATKAALMWLQETARANGLTLAELEQIPDIAATFVYSYNTNSRTETRPLIDRLSRSIKKGIIIETCAPFDSACLAKDY